MAGHTLLWKPAATFDRSLEVHWNVDLHPRPVLLHRPQHHQDVSDI